MSTDSASPTPAPTPVPHETILQHVEDGLASISNAFKGLLTWAKPTVDEVVADVLPTMEPELVAEGNAIADGMIATGVAALIAAEPALAPFAPKINSFGDELVAKVLDGLATKFPPKPPTGAAS